MQTYKDYATPQNKMKTIENIVAIGTIATIVAIETIVTMANIGKETELSKNSVQKPILFII